MTLCIGPPTFTTNSRSLAPFAEAKALRRQLTGRLLPRLIFNLIGLIRNKGLHLSARGATGPILPPPVWIEES